MKNKTKLILFTLLPVISLLLLVSIKSSAKAEGTPLNNNFTVNKMIEVWKGKSKEDFNAYFAEYADEQRVFAGSKEGGIFTYKPGVKPSEMTDCGDGRYILPDGTIGEYSSEIEGIKSATIEEVKKNVQPYLK